MEQQAMKVIFLQEKDLMEETLALAVVAVVVLRLMDLMELL